MIYTIGKAEIYDEILEAGGPPLLKRGRADGYEGGSVWRDLESAQRAAAQRPGFKAYGVDAEWDETEAPDVDPEMHYLLRSAVIGQLRDPQAGPGGPRIENR